VNEKKFTTSCVTKKTKRIEFHHPENKNGVLHLGRTQHTIKPKRDPILSRENLTNPGRNSLTTTLKEKTTLKTNIKS
jgi:hypothetical protein